MTTELETLTKRVEELEAELKQLRAPSLPAVPHGWDEGDRGDRHDGPGDDASVSHAWLTWLEPKHRPRPRVPRLPFQVLFLAGCAAAAGVADLQPLWIAAVMGMAWLLVALTEWSGVRADRRRRLEEIALPAQFAAAPELRAKADPSWFAPPVEQTIEQGGTTSVPATDGATVVARLKPAASPPAPPPPAETTVETTVETTMERAKEG
jgi:hypothetical protein